MLRTVFTIGIFAVLGLFLLKIVFGIFGALFGVLLWLLSIAIPIFVVGFAIYLVIRLVSPDTARKLRERWSGSSY